LSGRVGVRVLRPTADERQLEVLSGAAAYTVFGQAFTPPDPLDPTAPDRGFVDACDTLLANRLMTAQWWEEDQLDETGFYRVRGKALSYVTRPDGSVLGIWKNRLVATTTDRGQTWTPTQFAGNMPNNGSKYWLQRTADGRYGLVLNPTNRNRYPLALMPSNDSATFTDLFSVHGELPDQRFGGYLKNIGPQYVRGIVEGNGTPPDVAQAFWLTYSVNKEDIWVARVPTPVAAVASGPINDDFDSATLGTLPAGWNVYSPLWAPVRVAAPTAGQPNRALEFRDEDPYDYARAIRVFPATHGVKVSFKIFARQTNARFEIDLLDAAGARPVRLALGVRLYDRKRRAQRNALGVQRRLRLRPRCAKHAHNLAHNCSRHLKRKKKKHEVAEGARRTQRCDTFASHRGDGTHNTSIYALRWP
jgi:hypothetical protein